MKRFIYDQIVDRSNICNMESEADKILNLLINKRNVVIYAPRNYGKTSVVKNIVIPELKKITKSSFIYFVDLLDIKDINHLNQVLQKEFELTFSKSFPATNLVHKTKEFLQGFQPQFSIDPLTTQTSISLVPNNSGRNLLDIAEIFNLINQINKKHPALIVFDEFQVVSKFENLDATFRNLFQNLENIPIIIMGSQKHMLLNLFANPNAPLANFGIDVEFQPIDYEKYYLYIKERFAEYNIDISFEAAKYIQDMMNRVPESINIISDHVLIYCREKKLKYFDDNNKTNLVINAVVENKRSRFDVLLNQLTKGEENILISIAKHREIVKPNSKTFQSTVSVSPRAISKIINKLLQNGFLEYNNKKYYLSDPLLNIYLTKYR